MSREASYADDFMDDVDASDVVSKFQVLRTPNLEKGENVITFFIMCMQI
jgi:hypothetical protein